jgi:hypothetical protein
MEWLPCLVQRACRILCEMQQQQQQQQLMTLNWK